MGILSCSVHSVDVLVIGAGQAGICAAYELQKRGFTGFAGTLGADDGVTKWRKKPALGTFVVLDAEDAPGGAWQHRWPTLTMATVNHIADLPGQPIEEMDDDAPARLFVPAYFAEFEYENDLPILRPVRVYAVKNAEDETARVDAEKTATGKDEVKEFSLLAADTPAGTRQESSQPGLLEAHTSAGIWRARFIINCTGTWRHPFVPYVSGAEKFRGKQYHTQTYPGPERFWKQRVLVVGGGVSAINHVEELAGEAKKVRWVTRTPPRWREPEHEHSLEQARGKRQGKRGASAGNRHSERNGGGNGSRHGESGLSPNAGRDAEERARARAEAGLPPLPVVAQTGLLLTEHVRELRASGILKRKPMFDSLDADGAWWAEKHENFDAIIWATGFRHDLGHLRPLKLRSPLGGIQMEGVRAARDSRVYLIGYGASASTVGARRDARIVAREIKQRM